MKHSSYGNKSTVGQYSDQQLVKKMLQEDGSSCYHYFTTTKFRHKNTIEKSSVFHLKHTEPFPLELQVIKINEINGLIIINYSLFLDSRAEG